MTDATETLAGRFIPALAGNTSPRGPDRAPPPVHPRARGEHGGGTYTMSRDTGSSPRSRGTRCTARTRTARFIPALAGNTARRSMAHRPASVHPRARGEHVIVEVGRLHARGSSPRSRGTRSWVGTRKMQLRFIPALAGNTAARRRRQAALPVHPRARGEHQRGLRRSRAGAGSSPRSRGTRLGPTGSCPTGRFIPALAGNTNTTSTRIPPMAVHPRARGEHGRSAIPRSSQCGSSPRSRGTRAIRLTPQPETRFIPALAGNTSPAGRAERS